MIMSQPSFLLLRFDPFPASPTSYKQAPKQTDKSHNIIHDGTAGSVVVGKNISIFKNDEN